MRKFTLMFIAILTALILTGCPGTGQDAVPEPVTYEIGDTGPAGGLIFFVDEVNTFSWDYLEAAPSNQSTSDLWTNLQLTAIGTTSTSIGYGPANTTAIMSQTMHVYSAAKQCDDLVITNNGITYEDWFLPSKDELFQMDLNTNIFTGNGYWSSSEFDAKNSWGKGFGGGSEASALKDSSKGVRAIRSF